MFTTTPLPTSSPTDRFSSVTTEIRADTVISYVFLIFDVYRVVASSF